MASFRILDQDDQEVGSGPTVAQAITAAASKLGVLPWHGCEGPTGEQVVRSLIENGEYCLALP